MKKILLVAGILLVALAPMTGAFDRECMADREDDTAAEGSSTTAGGGSAASGNSNCDTSFLGLRPWHCGLLDSDGNIISPSENGGNGSISISTFIATIVLNIVVDATLIAGLLVTGFIIYGGYLYMFAEGDPGKVAKGKNTIKSATIGAIIVVSANVIFNTISVMLLGETGATAGELPAINASVVVNSVLNWVVSLGGITAVAFIVYGGISYMTAAGDAGKLAKAKNSIKYALIGLIIVALAAIISNFIFSAAGSAQVSS